MTLLAAKAFSYTLAAVFGVLIVAVVSYDVIEKKLRS